MGVAGVTHRSARGKPKSSHALRKAQGVPHTPARWLTVFHFIPLFELAAPSPPLAGVVLQAGRPTKERCVWCPPPRCVGALRSFSAHAQIANAAGRGGGGAAPCEDSACMDVKPRHDVLTPTQSDRRPRIVHCAPKGRAFSKPTASPWQREQPHRFPAARANRSPRHGSVVTGRANHWAVGPKTITLFISHQGDALGWETKRAFGPQMPCCANQNPRIRSREIVNGDSGVRLCGMPSVSTVWHAQSAAMGVAGVTHRSARREPSPATPFARLRACHTTAPARWLSVVHLFPLLKSCRVPGIVKGETAPHCALSAPQVGGESECR